MTEGRGPMVAKEIAFLNKENANAYIDKQPGVMGIQRKWSEKEYGDWMVKEFLVVDN